MENYHFDALVIGSGMGALTTACLLAKEGKKVGVLEQNWLIGGCTSSYWRKGFVFESGATTLVGLDENMPLRYLIDELGVDLPATALDLPMQVHLKSGEIVNRYQNLDDWIAEAERVFGKKNQRAFWEFCYQVSQFVWETSLKQTAFPPTRLPDLLYCIKNANLKQLRYAGYAFFSMEWLLKKYDLYTPTFIDFVNEQLLITAQNHLQEVNVLFGATALCYTNYGNYYMNGGLINLVTPFADYLEKQGSKVFLRHKAEKIEKQNGLYYITTTEKGKQTHLFSAPLLVSGIPINNTLELFQLQSSQTSKTAMYLPRLTQQQLPSEKLNSAFQVGIGFRKSSDFESIHHQIHLDEPLPEVGSASIFVSLSHPQDHSRADQAGNMVASVSTHVKNPAQNMVFDKAKAEQAVIAVLIEKKFFRKEDIIYLHSSMPKSWEKWTNRKFGFVGGYPQYLSIKPWQMIDSRLDGAGAYLCGDTTYPGQGIPGVVLSGIIAYEKIRNDRKNKKT